MGRPSIYTPEIVRAICERLAGGEPLAQICRDDGMPCVTTVWNWEKADPRLAESIARAREAGEEVIGADCLRIADTPVEGEERTTKPDGSVEIKCGDMLGHRKLQVDTRLKLLAKWNPRKWGDKIQQEVTGPNGGPQQHVVITTDDPVEASKAWQDLIRGG